SEIQQSLQRHATHRKEHRAPGSNGSDSLMVGHWCSMIIGTDPRSRRKDASTMPLTVTSSWPVITRISVLLLLCGCTAPAAIEPETAAGCDQMAAQRLVGMARPSDEDAA